MAKKCYIGVNGVARQGKKMYVGVNGIAKKVKKAYIGVDGKARLFFVSEPVLSYYGSVTSLSAARKHLVGTANNNYVIFAGGSTNNTVVDAYNSSLTRSTPTALSVGRQDSGHHAAVGNYAFIPGGLTSSTYHSRVDYYDDSLTRGVFDMNRSRCLPGAVKLGNYCIIAGGRTGTGSTNYSTHVDAYNTSFTNTQPTAMQEKKNEMGSAVAGNYAIFAGGNNSSSSYTDTVDYYDTSLTHGTADALNSAIYEKAGASVGGYALMAGGYSTRYSATVNTYSSSLTKGQITSLSVGRRYIMSTQTDNYAIFAGGYDGSYLNTVDVYDSSLTLISMTGLSVGGGGAAATINNKAIVAIGDNGEASNVVNAYIEN